MNNIQQKILHIISLFCIVWLYFAGGKKTAKDFQ